MSNVVNFPDSDGFFYSHCEGDDGSITIQAQSKCKQVQIGICDDPTLAHIHFFDSEHNVIMERKDLTALLWAAVHLLDPEEETHIEEYVCRSDGVNGV